MNLAVNLYTTVYAEDFDLQGKTARSVFIEKAMAEIGMTKAGASTYHQNIRNKIVNGKGLYEYNKTATKTDEVIVEAEKAPAVEEVKAYVPEHRWTVMMDGKVVDSFPSRAKAQEAAKAMGGKWGDATKAA